MAQIKFSDTFFDVQLPSSENMTDEEFFHFCQENRKVAIERNENHQIIFMPPTSSEFSFKNNDISTDLTIWNRKLKTGLVSESSAGFFLPDNSMRSPDDAWISNERWNALSPEKRNGFAYITPDFIVELASPSDRLIDQKQKMEKWRNNGVRLGWLIEPATEMVFIYRIDGTVSKVEGLDNVLSGEDVLPGFEFALKVLR